jgi:hypothetical protein
LGQYALNKYCHSGGIATLFSIVFTIFKIYTINGSIAGAISIPTRHIHQVIEMCHKEDIQYCIDLLVKAIQSIDDFDWSWDS